MRLGLWVLIGGVLLLTISSGQAQVDCGVVDGINFPVDTAQYSLTQDYAVLSSRHQGRYHTGEDWHNLQTNSIGEPVQAVARGRVTYSSVNGWGRDGGAIIIEHTFPDGAVYYTLYGHITESEAYRFPTRLACVQAGDVLGVIADVRPAPHLHFEVRVGGANQGAVAGAGYSIARPYDEGLRDPSKFLINQQAWLSLWHDWHLLIGSERMIDYASPFAPPLMLTDNSTLYLDAEGLTVRRATPDGRVLWRVRQDVPAVALEGWRGQSLLILSDGTMQVLDVESGAVTDSWRVEARFSGAPLVVGDELLIPAPDNRLIRISADRRTVLAEHVDIPAYDHDHALLDGAFVILTPSRELHYYAPDGTHITDAQMRSQASFGQSWQGDLLVYSRGGLWQVTSAGEWSLFIESAPITGDNSALLTTDERLYLFDGNRLYAYDRSRQLLWQTNTPPVTGRAQIAWYEGTLLITSNHGDIVLVNDQGTFCNQLQVFGQDSAGQWHHLGSDQRLRLAIADQLLALNWRTFNRPCTA
ncbi:MAG: peptidoglycan DD-metalloendopeptidase family protein [Anaerolineae bacterium]